MAKLLGGNVEEILYDLRLSKDFIDKTLGVQSLSLKKKMVNRELIKIKSTLSSKDSVKRINKLNIHKKKICTNQVYDK